jgi:hypothetical protein
MSAIEAALFFAGLLVGMGIAFAVVNAIMNRVMGWRK